MDVYAMTDISRLMEERYDSTVQKNFWASPRFHVNIVRFTLQRVSLSHCDFKFTEVCLGSHETRHFEEAGVSWNSPSALTRQRLGVPAIHFEDQARSAVIRSRQGARSHLRTHLAPQATRTWICRFGKNKIRIDHGKLGDSPR
jgi:hypothetical protein